MFKILIYGLATFVETGLGVWIFKRMFSLRRCLIKTNTFSIWILLAFILVSCYTFPNAYFTIGQKRSFIWLLIGILAGLFALFAYRTKNFKQISVRLLNNIKGILFILVALFTTWQYWDSYISAVSILLGNTFLPLFLFTFYQCGFIEAYLWEVFYLTNLGLLKITYVIYVGTFGGNLIDEFVYGREFHTYGEGIYLLLICVAIIILLKYLTFDQFLVKIFKNHKRLLSVIVSFEWGLLVLLTSFGTGGLNEKDLTGALIIVIGIMFFLFVLLAKSFKTSLDSEKNILIIRNESVKQQYKELNATYERYRCLLHDEKYMIFYLKECLDNGKFEEGKRFLENYQDNIAKTEKHSWTGIVTLDFVLNIKMRKMDEAAIKFNLDSRIESIPMEDADFVVMLANLFDNAIEASGKCEPDNRFIELSVQNVNEMFILRIKNIYLSEPTMKNNRFITSKEDKNKHGWGIESVKHIVEKYDGQITFQHSNNIFEVSIIINQ